MKSCATILGSPVVPDVKYIIMISSLAFTRCGRTKGAAFAIPAWKSRNPSGISGPTLISSSVVGLSGMAAATWSAITRSPAATIALIPAVLHRYTASFLVSR